MNKQTELKVFNLICENKNDYMYKSGFICHATNFVSIGLQLIRLLTIFSKHWDMCILNVESKYSL